MTSKPSELTPEENARLKAVLKRLAEKCIEHCAYSVCDDKQRDKNCVTYFAGAHQALVAVGEDKLAYRVCSILASSIVPAGYSAVEELARL